jgi:outer membrane protein
MREQSLMQFQQQAFGQPNGEVYIKNEELFAPIKEKVFTAIEAIAKEQGMVYVLDRSTEAVVVYADSEFDLTFKVLDKLNKKK